jgi:hypothetical protein
MLGLVLSIPNEKKYSSKSYSKQRIYVGVGDDETVPFKHSKGRAG